jgi:hypothetical protein
MGLIEALLKIGDETACQSLIEIFRPGTVREEVYLGAAVCHSDLTLEKILGYLHTLYTDIQMSEFLDSFRLRGVGKQIVTALHTASCSKQEYG